MSNEVSLRCLGNSFKVFKCTTITLTPLLLILPCDSIVSAISPLNIFEFFVLARQRHLAGVQIFVYDRLPLNSVTASLPHIYSLNILAFRNASTVDRSLKVFRYKFKLIQCYIAQFINHEQLKTSLLQFI